MKNFRAIEPVAKMRDLSPSEVRAVTGGVGPVGAYAIGIGLGSLFIAAYEAGYQFGADLARAENDRARALRGRATSG